MKKEAINGVDANFEFFEDVSLNSDKDTHLREIMDLNSQETRKIKSNEAATIELENNHLQKILLKFEYDCNPEIKLNPKNSILFHSLPFFEKKEPLENPFKKGRSMLFINPPKISNKPIYEKSVSCNNIDQELNKFKEDACKTIFRNSDDRNSQERLSDDIKRYTTLTKKRKSTFKQEIYKKITQNEELSKPLIEMDDLPQTRKRRNVINKKNDIYRFLTKRNRIYQDTENSEEYVFEESNKRWLIYPNSRFMKVWDIVIGLLTVYTIIVTPLLLAFSIRIKVLLIFELIVDVIYLIDCFSHFFIPYYDIDDNLITDHKLIARNYLLGWFWIDILSGIPYGSIENLIDYDRSMGLSKFQRFTKITHIFKVTKLFKSKNFVYRRKKLQVSKSLKYFFLFFTVFLFISHVFTCIWIYLAQFNHSNWISAYGLLDSSHLVLYVSSLYFNWATVFTVGYGDITPKNTDERIYAILIMTFGLMGYAFALSTLSNIISTKDSITQTFIDNYNDLQAIRVNHKIPEHLYYRIAKFLNYDYKHNTNEKYEFIQDLPTNFKNLLITQMYNDFICNFKFLRYENDNFRSRVIMLLKPVSFLENEYILYENEYLEEFILVRQGYLKILMGVSYNEESIMKIFKFEHFGDILIFSNQKSPVSIKVGNRATELFFITKKDLIAISSEFPEIFDKITLISTYNYLIMLEIIEKKKEEIDRERLKQIKLSNVKNDSTASSYQDEIIPKQNMLSEFLNNNRKNSFHEMARGMALSNKNLKRLYETKKSIEQHYSNSINDIDEEISENKNLSFLKEFDENENNDNNIQKIPENVDNFLNHEFVKYSEEKLRSFGKIQEAKFMNICKTLFNKLEIY
jgi:CRP-like cAMP-binding protein